MKKTARQLSLFDSVQSGDKDRAQPKKEEKLTLKYNLFDLPTAQHKAGLAGLLVMIESMKRRGMAPLPEISELGASSVVVTLTEKSLQVLFDDLFDAEIVEIQVKNKWNNKKPKQTIEINVEHDGKKKKEKRFIYDILQPKGLFLQTFYPDNNGAWVQLWRNMLWKILRAQTPTRIVYKERSESKPSSLAVKMFKALLKEQKKRKVGGNIDESIAGSVFIGAQDKNAEIISFTGIPSENFILHFWHIVSLTFIPRSFSLERSKEQGTKIKWQDSGFVLVIPEPSNLEYFKEDITVVLMTLEIDLAGKSKKPKRALIDLSQEGGLEYLYYLTKYHAQQGLGDGINAVEIYHIKKQGNNVRMLASDRLAPQKNILSRYERLRSFMMNPLFKSFYLINILRDTAWYNDSLKILTTCSIELLVYASGRTPTNMPFFSKDAGRRFAEIRQGMEQMEEKEMNTDEGRDDLLARRIYELVRRYIRIKAENKSGEKLKDFGKNEAGKIIYPTKYRQAVEKVSLDAFLAMRGRREQDFVEYFTGSICSISHFLPGCNPI